MLKYPRIFRRKRTPVSAPHGSAWLEAIGESTSDKLSSETFNALGEKLRQKIKRTTTQAAEFADLRLSNLSYDTLVITNSSATHPRSPRRETFPLPKAFWSTEPFNFEAAKTAILQLYRLKGLQEPEHILQADSPCAAMTVALCSGWFMESQPLAHRFYLEPSSTDGITDNGVCRTILRQCEQAVTVDFNSLASAYASSLIAKTGNVLDESVKEGLAAVFKAQLTQIRDEGKISLTETQTNRRALLEHVTQATCTTAITLPYLTTYASDSKARENPILNALLTIMENAGWWLAFDKAVIICDRPKHFNHDLEDRLHSTRQAAVEYRDGWKIYAYHGVVVPERVIMQPETINIPEIQKERNIEMRRILIDQYGLQRYLQDSHAKMLHKDKYGELWRELPPPGMKEVSISGEVFMASGGHSLFSTGERVDELVTMLHCFDKSSNREYWIRVPPTVKTAHEASAWTFNQPPEEYAPVEET